VSCTPKARRFNLLRDLRLEEPSLETVFLEMTGKELRD